MTAIVNRRPGPSGSTPRPSARARRLSELTTKDRILRAVLAVAAIIPTFALVFLAYQMLKSAYPSIVFNGWHFFTSKQFNIGNLYGSTTETKHGYKAPVGASYGILALLFGTLVSSVIALILAVPVAVAGAVLLVEKLPHRLQGPLGIFLELLAGIPSVVFGLWGVFTLGPLLSRTVFKWIAALGIPWLKGPTGSGQGLLTASVVLAVMIIPIIASITRELVRSVPAISKEGAFALGLTPSETIRVVTLPYVRTGIIAAAILGWARALGETIAVLLISSSQIAIPHSIFDPFATMAATIADILDSALTDSTHMAVDALAEVGLVLLVVTMLTNFAGRLVARRFSDKGLPVGRGRLMQTAAPPAAAGPDAPPPTGISRRRSLGDLIFWGACGLAFVLIAAPSISVIVSVFHQAFPALGWQLFTQTTRGQGIENAILGTLLLLVGVLIVAGSIGIGAGMYLAEFASGRSEQVLRFFSEVLAGMPSIVIGYIGYVTLVVSFHWRYSLLAAVIALSVLVMPYIVKTTEVALRQVPTTLREGAAGLGMPRSATLRRILLPTALPGIVSGLIVALAISTGELAPLLFTANFTDSNPSLQLLHHSVPYLTYVTYTDISLPGSRAHATAAAAGLISLAIIIILITIGRFVAGRARKQTARMSL